MYTPSTKHSTDRKKVSKILRINKMKETNKLAYTELRRLYSVYVIPRARRTQFLS